MLIPRAALANQLLFAQLLQGIAKSDKPIVEIDGYPAHATKIDDLDPTQRAQIKALAQRIVDSHKTNTPIIAFAVDGHADVDLAVPQGQRAESEQIISQKRAEAARNVLLTELGKLDRGSSIAAAMPFTAQGFGSKFRKKIPGPGHALTEAEMKKNRRVEFFIAQFVKPAPRQPQPPARPKPPEVGLHWRIQIKGGLTVGTPSLPEPLDNVGGGNTTLFIKITDLDRKQTASFIANITGMILPSATIGPPQSGPQTETITEGKPVEFETNLGTSLFAFNGSVEVTQGPGAGVSVLSAGGNFDFEFEAMALKGIFPRKHPVSIPAGSSIFALPKASLGFVSKGGMTLQGNPSAVP